MKKVLSSPYFLPSVFFLSLLIRLLFIPHPGFEADIAYWKWWSDAAAKKGVVKTVTEVGLNYPPLYLYLLKITGHLYHLLAGPNNPALWDRHNFLFLILIKTPYIFADLATAYLMYWFLKKLSTINYQLSTISHLLPSLYLLNPFIIYDSAIWGQTDSLAVLLIFLTIFFAVKKKIFLAGALIALSLFFKMQTLFFIPLIFLLIAKRGSLKKIPQALWGFLFTAILINLPYILSHTIDQIVQIMLGSVDYFPYVSLNAYNLGWLLIAGVSDKFLDRHLFLGLISYKSLGISLFLGAYLLAFLNLLKNKAMPCKLTRHRLDNLTLISSFFLSCALASFAFFILPTQMHERYLYPTFLFLYLAIGTRNEDIILIPLTFLLTLTGTLNLHLVMIKNYPANNLPFLAFLDSRPLSLVIAAINLLLFSSLLWLTAKNMPKKALFYITSVLCLLITLPLIKNAQALNKATVSLSSLAPVSQSQEWSLPKKNKSVDDNLLSSCYFFYNQGIGSHANSRLVYQLNQKFSHFETDFGVDVEAGESASVQFVIRVDQKTVFQSPVMKKWTSPGHASVDVLGAKTLELIITDAGDGRWGDHADWLNPRLIADR